MHTRPNNDDERSRRLVLGGSLIEGIAGLAAATVAVLGLVGVLPMELAAVSIIVLGAGMVIEGFALETRYTEEDELRGGMTVQLVGGLAAVALGLLSVFDFVPGITAALGVVWLGGALVLGAGATAQVDSERHVASGVQVLVGLFAAGLGLLSLAHLGHGAPMILLLAACLGCGASLAITGATVGARHRTMRVR
jgi:hypothetical protein